MVDEGGVVVSEWLAAVVGGGDQRGKRVRVGYRW